MPYKIMPAPSGWVYCQPVLEESGEVKSVLKKPVVAWAFEELEDHKGEPASINCFPVCPFEIACPTDDNYALMMPDGRFEVPFDRIVDTEQEAIDALEQCRKASERMRAHMRAKK